jgi:hypothetical protein
MAGKARRVASRQAQLGRRRKRQAKGPSGVPLAETALTTDADEPSTGAGLQAPESSVPVPSPTPAPAPVDPGPAPPRPAVRTSSETFARVRGERPPAQNYIGAELKRILVMAGSVLAVIIVLGIIL